MTDLLFANVDVVMIYCLFGLLGIPRAKFWFLVVFIVMGMSLILIKVCKSELIFVRSNFYTRYNKISNFTLNVDIKDVKHLWIYFCSVLRCLICAGVGAIWTPVYIICKQGFLGCGPLKLR